MHSLYIKIKSISIHFLNNISLYVNFVQRGDKPRTLARLALEMGRNDGERNQRGNADDHHTTD